MSLRQCNCTSNNHIMLLQYYNCTSTNHIMLLQYYNCTGTHLIKSLQHYNCTSTHHIRSLQKLLITASNSNKTNGYFGAAYWHPEHQQVVIAHRGTDPTNVGALWADLNGVLRNQYVRQMESASTFAQKLLKCCKILTE
jgi:hypothetical protein